MFIFTLDYHQPVYSMSCWITYISPVDSATMGHPGNLSQADELFLMMVCLQLNLKEQDVANRF